MTEIYRKRHFLRRFVRFILSFLFTYQYNHLYVNQAKFGIVSAVDSGDQ